MNFLQSFLSSDIRTATPLLIAALGIVFSARAGIINVGTEGFMLVGALMGVVGSRYSGSAFVGALAAMACTLVLAALFAYFTINLQANQTVVGVAINIFAMGFTITLNRIIFGANTSPPIIDVFDAVPIPGLSRIPVIGPALFNQPLLCYLAFLAVPVAWYVMQKTHIGLKVRAVGENPKAADTVGINVWRVRWAAILFSGALAGLGGAFVSMGQLSFFTENMISGRGYMVLAAVVFGRYSPVGVLVATLVFGAGDALMYQIQAANLGVPYQISMMLPYFITLLAVCGLIRKNRSPAASGEPYVKE